MEYRVHAKSLTIATAIAVAAAVGGCSSIDRTFGTHLSKDTTSQTTAPERETAMVSADSVRQAQQDLTAQGLYKGPIDGVIGPETQQALRQYQKDHNLTQTATLDSETLRSLNSQTTNSGSSR
jgi:peptidoglycan hydrolase-like protein with peptidoglycan-binding domain